MCNSIAAIMEQCGANPGGIAPKVWGARKVDIESIPSATGLIVSGDIVMKTGKYFVPWDLELDSGSLKTVTEGSLFNPSFKTNLGFKIPRNNPTVDVPVQDSIGQAMVFIVRENSGHLRITGSLERGAYVGFKVDSGTKGADFAGKEFDILWDSQKELPYYYTGDLPIAA